jgi:murein hydrolase activator
MGWRDRIHKGKRIYLKETAMRMIVTILLFISLVPWLNCQTKKELEGQRQKTLNEISYVDDLIKETTREKSTGINELKIIGNKLSLRENVIYGMREEIMLLTGRIELNNTAIDLMEKDLLILRKDYAKAIINAYKSEKGNPDMAFLLSARDFNQGYKRLRYLQQVAKFRRRESEIIIELRDQIEMTKAKLQEDLNDISDLKDNEVKQKNLLQKEQERKKMIVRSLGNKEKQLRKELEEKKRIAKKIEAEIGRLIEEERKKGGKQEFTPEQTLIGKDFAENKGRLPWPVERGIITSQFGLQKHPVLTYVTEDNIGIEITSYGKTTVRSIFRGQVVRVFAISGANMTIIVRHGKYLSVYQNIINIKIKRGDNIEMKQEIGDVFCDEDNGNKAVLKFMIFEENEKYIDPELWIAKK